MKKPEARYYCNKCGYHGSQSGHANCNYFACTTLEYQYIEQQEKELTDLRARLEKAERDAASKQARIDEMMLEYCPDEMTHEQKEGWGKHQVPVSTQEQRILGAALRRSVDIVSDAKVDAAIAKERT